METFTDSLIINVKGGTTRAFLFLPWAFTTLALPSSLLHKAPTEQDTELCWHWEQQSLPSHGQGMLFLSAAPAIYSQSSRGRWALCSCQGKADPSPSPAP